MNGGGLQATFAALLVLGAAVLWWLAAIQARDTARRIARAFCKRQGWQLLDQTVSLAGMRLKRTGDRLGWLRRYRFEFSPDGGRRQRGELLLAGNRAVRILAETDAGDLIEEPGPKQS